MRKQIMALMDSEEPYAVRFMEHMNRKKAAPFVVQAFTDGEKLREYADTHRIEVLLIAERDLETVGVCRAGQVIVLADRNTGSGSSYPAVSKYQASSAIMREVMEIYSRKEQEDGGEASDPVLKPPMKIIGIFSPVGRCLKTSYALALGQCLARKKATLYFNFEAASGLRYLLGEEWKRDLSDIIYYIRRGDRNITARLIPLIREIGALGYVPPSPFPAEIYQVTADEWNRLFASLRRDSSYEALILDLGDLPLLNPDILEECDLIYMPVRDDEIAKAKVAAFQDMLRELDEESAQRIRPIRLAAGSGAAAGKNWAEQLPYGALGRYAEECIEADHL